MEIYSEFSFDAFKILNIKKKYDNIPVQYKLSILSRGKNDEIFKYIKCSFDDFVLDYITSQDWISISKELSEFIFLVSRYNYYFEKRIYKNCLNILESIERNVFFKIYDLRKTKKIIICEVCNLSTLKRKTPKRKILFYAAICIKLKKYNWICNYCNNEYY